MIDIEQLFKRYYRQLYVYAFQILQDEEKSKDMIGAPDKPCGVGRADANPKLLLNDT